MLKLLKRTHSYDVHICMLQYVEAVRIRSLDYPSPLLVFLFFQRLVRILHFYVFLIEFHFKCIISIFRFNKAKMLLFSLCKSDNQNLFGMFFLAFLSLLFIYTSHLHKGKKECSSEWRRLDSQLLDGAR